MDGLLSPVNTARKVQANIDRFETLSLNNSTKSLSNSTKSKRSILEITTLDSNDTSSDSNDLRPSTSSSKTSISPDPNNKKHKRHDSLAFLQKSYLTRKVSDTLPDDAREILKDQPDHEDLYAVLQYLHYGIEGKHDFNIHTTGSKQSQIINALVTVVIPAHWHTLREPKLSYESAELRQLLILCLQSVAGLGAVLMQIQKFSREKSSANNLLLEDVLSLLGSILEGSHLLSNLLTDTNKLYDKDSQRRLNWQEVGSLFAGSKIFSITSHSVHSSTDDNLKTASWFTDGPEYSRWLARNISNTIMRLNPLEKEQWLMVSQIVKRSLSLGFRDQFITETYSLLLLGSKALWTPLHLLLNNLSIHEQKIFFNTMLRDLARKYLQSESSNGTTTLNKKQNEDAIGGVAAMIVGVIQNNTVLEDHLIEWLSSTGGEYSGLGLDIRRAALAAVALNHENLKRVLEKCMVGFSDKLQILHNPILQQESMAQTILLAAGNLHRLDSKAVEEISKSSVFLQAVSNRLAASVPRARFLGMLVGVGVSKLVDAPSKVMNFDLEEMDSEETKNWLNLVNISDRVGNVGTLRQFRSPTILQDIPAKRPKPLPQKATTKKPAQSQTSKIIAIEEIQDDDENEDEGLVPYPKPDDDPSDSEEDPTLIDRSKPSVPVYIIDLIRQLQVQDKPEIVELALKTAPSLIRRKDGFGTELSTNIHALLSALINIQDSTFNVHFQQQRLNALIACLITQPSTVGPWAATTYFEGDFSLTQRAALLSMVGLGSRELAGYNDTDKTSSISNLQLDFPSNRLPSYLVPLYSPLSTITTDLQHSTLRPLALAAADKLSGPDILKIRTFSSRMAVEKKNQTKAAERSKRIPRDLHKLLSDSIYLPLCCRMSLLLNSRVNISRSNVFEPHITRLFLQTLVVVFVSLGPNAMQLSSVTRETLILLLALHNTPVLAHDPVVLPALLQLLLTTLDINVEAGTTAEERLVTEFGTMCAELIRWAAELEGRVNVPVASADEMGENQTGMPWPVIVAGIQVKWHEVGRKFQGRMLGLMGGDMEF